MSGVERVEGRQQLAQHSPAARRDLAGRACIDPHNHARQSAGRAPRMVLDVHAALNLAFLTPGEMGGLEVYARRLAAALAKRDDVQLTLLLPRMVTQ